MMLQMEEQMAGQNSNYKTLHMIWGSNNIKEKSLNFIVNNCKTLAKQY